MAIIPAQPRWASTTLLSQYCTGEPINPGEPVRPWWACMAMDSQYNNGEPVRPQWSSRTLVSQYDHGQPVQPQWASTTLVSQYDPGKPVWPWWPSTTLVSQHCFHQINPSLCATNHHYQLPFIYLLHLLHLPCLNGDFSSVYKLPSSIITCSV